MTSPEDAGRMIEQTLIGAGYDFTRDTPERMLAQLRRSFSAQHGGAKAAAEALGVSDRTVRRWFQKGLPEKSHAREHARELISGYYADQRGPRYITPARRAELLAATKVNIALTQDPDGEARDRNIGTDTPGSMTDARVIAELLAALKTDATPEQLADVVVNAVGSNWYRRALVPVGDLSDSDRADAYERFGADVDDAEGFSEGNDGYATVAWQWDRFTIGR